MKELIFTPSDESIKSLFELENKLGWNVLTWEEFYKKHKISSKGQGVLFK